MGEALLDEIALLAVAQVREGFVFQILEPALIIYLVHVLRVIQREADIVNMVALVERDELLHK